ncbi:MAG: hypothetical protein IPP61_06775 [Cytophagaceae bacterium]|nr:hypothetical protein [Cytophagaceae bacterium]MBL0302047.1 hypothetical protein [Cytophagaceae bacterium]MBL0324869.1 hypothetical protein [Cytophagaceae bacterium]
MKLKILLVVFSFFIFSCDEKNQNVKIEQGIYPCGIKDGRKYSSNVITEERILSIDNISTDSKTVIYGFRNSDDQRVFLPCNFPDELKLSIGKRVKVTYKVFEFENLNVRENPIELINYQIF